MAKFQLKNAFAPLVKMLTGKDPSATPRRRKRKPKRAVSSRRRKTASRRRRY